MLRPIGTALVTGATGFVGSTLCAKLKARGVTVRGLARHDANGMWDQLILTDITKPSLPEDTLKGVESVFHLASRVHDLSQVGGNEADYVSANVEGTERVLRAGISAGIRRFVFVSSVKAGGEGGDVCLDEAMEDNPVSLYGRTKLEAERLVFKLAREHNVHAVVLRFPVVYGPGNKGNFARMLRAIAARRFPPLPEFDNQRSLVHVDDAAEAAILAAEKSNANLQTYIVTDGRPYSTREIYTLMCLALGRGKRRLSIPISALRTAARVGDIVGRLRGRRFIFDSDALEKLACSAWYSSRKIETELGFQPTYDLERALPEMIAELRIKRNHENRPAKTS